MVEEQASTRTQDAVNAREELCLGALREYVPERIAGQHDVGVLLGSNAGAHDMTRGVRSGTQL
jgi:hypothetical protein